jgi:hypothetical protein
MTGSVSAVFQNWTIFCIPKALGTPYYNSKCPKIADSSDVTFANNVQFANWVFGAFGIGFLNITQWLFSFRYFEVAEMLGRKDKSNRAHIQARKITSKITIAGVVVIIL